VNFRPHKQVLPHVVADSTASIDDEVVIGVKAGAEIHAIAGSRIAVKASALHSDTTEKVETDFLAEAGLVDSVEVSDDWTIRLAEIISLAASPGSFKTKSDALLENNIGANARIKTPLFRTQTGEVTARAG